MLLLLCYPTPPYERVLYLSGNEATKTLLGSPAIPPPFSSTNGLLYDGLHSVTPQARQGGRRPALFLALLPLPAAASLAVGLSFSYSVEANSKSAVSTIAAASERALDLRGEVEVTGVRICLKSGVKQVSMIK